MTTCHEPPVSRSTHLTLWRSRDPSSCFSYQMSGVASSLMSASRIGWWWPCMSLHSLWPRMRPRSDWALPGPAAAVSLLPLEAGVGWGRKRRWRPLWPTINVIFREYHTQHHISTLIQTQDLQHPLGCFSCRHQSNQFSDFYFATRGAAVPWSPEAGAASPHRASARPGSS